MPGYRKHSSGQAFVELSGDRFYLGVYGSPKSRQEYHRLIAEWEAAGRRPIRQPEEMTMKELAAEYVAHAQVYYGTSPDGGASEVGRINAAVEVMVGFYGDTLASDFGPKAFKVCREAMVAKGWTRGTVNQIAGRIKAMVKWGVAEELIDPSVYHGLQAVAGLRRGRTKAPDRPPITAVADGVVEATLPHLPPMVADMVRLQRLTGMRPGEVVAMTTGEIEATGRVWVYTPSRHKTAHHGHRRVVYIGPRAQAILRPYLRRELDAPLFSPAASEAHRRAEAHKQRKTPLSCGNVPGSCRVRKPKRPPGEVYTTVTYRRCIGRAAAKAGVPDWHPNQLRHAKATELRRELGVDLAAVILGHSKLETTQVYAEADHVRAAEAARKLG